ncbi:MAG: hypothetical protein HUU47_10660 [Bacteroidetes bacterium]|nr:hypothetical protein [Bacteroidota bacterium]
MKPSKEPVYISPVKIFGALVLLNVILACIVFIFPTGKIKLNDKYSLVFVPLNKIFDKEEKVVVDVNKVIANINTVDTNLVSIDSKKLNKNKFEEILVPADKQIQYPGKNRIALTEFFKSLSDVETQNTLIRIIHYGDSQLEGDRISDYLRNRFQLRFGGWGPGIILPYDISNSRISVIQKESKNWIKHAIYGNTPKLKNGFYGIAASSYLYKSEPINTQDSLKNINDSISKKQNIAGAWFDITNTKVSFPRVRQYNRITFLYSAENPFILKIKSKQGTSLVSEVLPNTFAACKTWKIEDNTSGISIYVNGESPYFYGIALDGNSGVAVDNFPMRGSSALGFETINRKMLNELYSQMNVKLIILQYGINLVPEPKTDYTWYEKSFSRQLAFIKAAAPFASVLVIGPSDMSMKTTDGYETYPNLVLIRNAMKKAAFQNGCAFWDLYAAMGGKNSMSSWVENNLAAKDFTHFSTKGARYVSEMLYNALIDEYQKYLKENKGI